jgi:hypothetical protein
MDALSRPLLRPYLEPAIPITAEILGSPSATHSERASAYGVLNNAFEYGHDLSGFRNMLLRLMEFGEHTNNILAVFAGMLLDKIDRNSQIQAQLTQ